MNYTLHQLRVFLKISQTRSVTKAAAELHLTQPAVSIQLSQFQQNFDVPLTEVVGRRLYVTDFGMEIARAAERVLDEVAEIDHRTEAFKGHLSGRLRLSIVGTAQYVLPFFIRDFTREHPGVDLSVDVTNRARVSESLDRNEVDFALVSLMPTGFSLNCIDLMRNTLHFVASTSILSSGRISKRELSSLPFLYREDGSGTREMMDEVVSRLGLPLNKRLELSSNEAIKQAIIAGLGCSIMPTISIKSELQEGSLRVIPMKGFPVHSTWRLVWHKQKKLSPVAEAFRLFISSQKQRIVREHFHWLHDYA